MDEQVLRARLAALDVAARLIGDVETPDSVVALAKSLEGWIIRPAPEVAARPDRQPCGAFLQPPWFIGRTWLTCCGSHRTSDGWHLTSTDPGATVFHSHHAPNHAGPERCACGGTVLPCPNAHPTDMRK